MAKIQKHIEIVSSKNTRLSSMSKKSRDATYRLLKRHYTGVGISLVDSSEDLRRLVDTEPDLVFLGMKYIPGPKEAESTWIAKYLNEHDIAHTGSSYLAHKLELNKHLAKQEVLRAGLATSAYKVIHKNSTQTIITEDMRYPLFVKPTNLGGGAGIDVDSVVYSVQQLNDKVASIATKHDSDSLVEQYLSGREFSVALMRDAHTNELLTMPLELCADPNQDGEQVISAATKSANTEVVLPLNNQSTKNEVCELARDAFLALGGRDYGRIDIRADKNGVMHFLEANLLPSLIEGYGSFPKACAINEGINYESMMLNIVQLGMNRSNYTEELMHKSANRLQATKNTPSVLTAAGLRP